MTTPAELIAKIRILANEPTVAAVTPGPGIVPAPPAQPVAWWRDRSTPLPPADPTTGNLPTCFDDVATAKRYAAGCYNASGVLSETPSEKLDALCDFIGSATTTAQQAEDRLKGAGYIDQEAAIYAARTGWMQGWSSGAPSLFTVKGRIADLISKPAAGGGSPSGKPPV